MSDESKVRPDTTEIVCFWIGVGLLFYGLWSLSHAAALIIFGLVMVSLSVAWYSIRKSEATND